MSAPTTLDTSTPAYHEAHRAAYEAHAEAYAAWMRNPDFDSFGAEYDRLTAAYFAMPDPTFAPVVREPVVAPVAPAVRPEAPVARPAAPAKVRVAARRRSPSLVAVMALLVTLPTTTVDAEALGAQLGISATTVRRALRDWRDEDHRAAVAHLIERDRRIAAEHPAWPCLSALDGCETCMERWSPSGSAPGAR